MINWYKSIKIVVSRYHISPILTAQPHGEPKTHAQVHGSSLLGGQSRGPCPEAGSVCITSRYLKSWYMFKTTWLLLRYIARAIYALHFDYLQLSFCFCTSLGISNQQTACSCGKWQREARCILLYILYTSLRLSLSLSSSTVHLGTCVY